MDYKTAHIQWLTNTKNFVPKYAGDYSRGVSYLETMVSLYADARIPQEMAKAMFVSDKCHYNKSYQVIKEVDRLVNKTTPKPSEAYFVTLNFNHNTWSVDKCVSAIKQIIAMEWVERCKANFEYHTEDGFHPHCHMYIETSIPKAKMKANLWRPKYIKAIIGAQNFIDIKPGKAQHEDKYIVLDKQDEKMEYVEKDIQFRKDNNIPDFEKNW